MWRCAQEVGSSTSKEPSLLATVSHTGSGAVVLVVVVLDVEVGDVVVGDVEVGDVEVGDVGIVVWDADASVASGDRP
jgi:hypothetical protein